MISKEIKENFVQDENKLIEYKEKISLLELKIKILVPLAYSFTIIFFIVKLLPPPVDDTIARLWDVLLLLRINGSKNTGKEVWISTPNMYPVGSIKFAFVNGKPAPNVIVGK